MIEIGNQLIQNKFIIQSVYDLYSLVLNNIIHLSLHVC